MSVLSETSKVQHPGNNSTVTPYVVPFYFFEENDIKVVVTDAEGTERLLKLFTDYSVSGEGSENGGSVTTSAAFDNTHTVTIYRDMMATQLTEYDQDGVFPPKTHERAFDRLTMLVQQMSRAVKRCLRVTEASAWPTGLVLPGSPGGRLIGYNGSGDLATFSAADVKAILQLNGTLYNKHTTYWADDSARGAAVPEFVGQVGVQLDEATVWIATGTSAGNWTEHKHTGITTEEIADEAVRTERMDSGCVTAAKIADDSVTQWKIADSNVTTAKIADNSVTPIKLTQGLRRPYIKVSDTKAAGTNGQSLTASSWNVIHLNTLDSDPEQLVAGISGNEVTLAAGTYEVLGIVPCYKSSSNADFYTRMVTAAGSTLSGINGTMGGSASGVSATSILTGRFTLDSQTAIRIEMYITAAASTGLAIASHIPVYTVLNLWKVG